MLGYIPALRDLFLTLDFIPQKAESLLPDRHPNPRYPPPDAVHDASVVPTYSWPSSRSNAHRIRGDAPWLEKKQSMQTILSSFDDYSNPFTKHKQELCLRGSAKFSISILEGTHGQEKQNQGGNKRGTVLVVLPCQLKCMESIFWTLYDARSWAIRMKILHRPSITSFLRKPCATLPLT